MSSNLSGSAATAATRASRLGTNHASRNHSAPDAETLGNDTEFEIRGLVERAQRGDMAAFEQLVVAYQCRAFARAYGLVRDENDARDVVQEAFLRAYVNLDKFEGNSAFFTWLFRIVSNLSIDHMRRPSRRENESLDAHAVEQLREPGMLSVLADSDPAEVLQNAYICRQIREGIEQLPACHRGVIIMREVKGMSYEDMARVSGVSKGTIMSRLFHARRKLQAILGDCYLEHFGRHPERHTSARRSA